MSEARLVWSVMVPTYNPDPHFLRESIDSVLCSHDAGTRELVIVDDASTLPASVQLLDTVAKQGIRVERSGSRGGLGRNFNRCVGLARGEIIHILHQDDRVMPDFYRRLSLGFDCEPGLGAACCGMHFIDAHGHATREGHRAQAETGVLADWIENVVVNLAIQTAGIVVHADVYRRLGGFRDDLEYVLDWEMWARIAREYPVWYDPEPLAQRREHARNESARLGTALLPWRERRRCLRDLCERLPVPVRGDAHRAARGHLCRLARSEARALFKRRNWRAASMALAGGLLIGPREMLLRRWLAGPPPPVPSRAPVRAGRAGARRQRLLLISEFIPVTNGAADTGAVQRLERNLQTLSHAGEVDAVFLTRFEASPAHEETLRTRWPFLRRISFVALPVGARAWFGASTLLWAGRGAMSFYHARPDAAVATPAVARRMRAVLTLMQPDLVFAFRIGAAAALLRISRWCPPIVTDLDDVEHVRVSRLARFLPGPPGRLVRVREAMAIRAERAVLRSSRAVLVCSDHDAGQLGRLDAHARVSVVENTARVPGPLAMPATPQALFVGVAKYPPNARAIAWLAREIWPLVRARMPSAKLVIVGEGARELGVEDLSGGIEVLGAVDELDGVYADSRIAVCPVREGSGTRIKLIEAALYGRASVSTTVGAEGLAFEPDREILIADTAEAFAQACQRLLDDNRNEGEEIARSALCKASLVYDPQRRHLKLIGILADCLSSHGDVAQALVPGTAA